MFWYFFCISSPSFNSRFFHVNRFKQQTSINFRSVIRSYPLHWKERLRSAGLALSECTALISGCLNWSFPREDISLKEIAYQIGIAILLEHHFETEVDPDVYDIHSPRIPSVGEMATALKQMPP